MAAVCGLVLGGCYAQTEPASDVGATSATLNAHGYTSGKQGQAFFQYSTEKNALGTGFGLQTPTLTFPPNVSGPFTARVSGLSQGTNYWYRVCGNDVGDQPFCNSDLEFTTTVLGAAVAFASPLSIVGTGVRAVGDFNGDGLPDLLVDGFPDGHSHVLLNNEDATFRDVATVDTGGVLKVGDFTRDGRQDLIAGTSSNISVFPGRDDGAFGTPITTAIPAPRSVVAVGDFNRDGKPDIVVAGRGAAAQSTVEVMLGNGNGTFQPPDQPLVASPQGTAWRAFAVGDFNRDGKPDLALNKGGCTTSACGVAVLLGNGNGTFGTERVYNAGTDAFGDLLAGAFDGGSTLDLITRTASGLTVLNGKGDGTFQVGPTYTPTRCEGRLLGTDINGDGKLDLVCAQGSAPFADTAVQLGNGDGTLQNPLTVLGNCTPNASADFNGDAKPDIPCTPFGSRGPYNLLILNATPPPS